MWRVFTLVLLNLFNYFVINLLDALSSGQLGAALAQFGVNQAAVDAANKGDVRAFAAAMEKDNKEESEPSNEAWDLIEY